MGGRYEMFLVISVGVSLALNFFGGKCWVLTHALGVLGENWWVLLSLTRAGALEDVNRPYLSRAAASLIYIRTQLHP